MGVPAVQGDVDDPVVVVVAVNEYRGQRILTLRYRRCRKRQSGAEADRAGDREPDVVDAALTVDLLERFPQGSITVIRIDNIVQSVHGDGCRGSGFARKIAGISVDGESLRFDPACGIFQFPVTVEAGCVRAGGHIRSRRLGDFVDEQPSLASVGGVAAVKQQIAVGGQVLPDRLPVGGIEVAGGDLLTVQRQRTCLSVSQKMDRVIFFSLCVKVFIELVKSAAVSQDHRLLIRLEIGENRIEFRHGVINHNQLLAG